MSHLPSISAADLARTTGGTQQQELREMAKTYCPQTYAQHAGAKTITRAMGERCLDEAGLGTFKGQLDRYFPTK